MGSDDGVLLCQKLAALVQSVLIYLLLPLLAFFSRLQRDGGGSLEDDEKEAVFVEAEEDEKLPELDLTFKFPTFEEFSRIGDKYEFVVEEPETFVVKEIDGDGVVEFSENGEVCGKKVNEKNEAMGEEFLDESHFRAEKGCDGFLSDGDFGGELDVDVEENQELTEHSSVDEESDGMEEVKKLEQLSIQNVNALNSDFLSEDDFNESSDHRSDDPGGEGSEKPTPKDSSTSDSGDANKLESLWEHQELIEQLKMELRKVRATGLPTILEESESPKVAADDLKPWKIDEMFHYKGCMDELHKFCKSYTEMMRKFDILNYQKMYAMGFLQLKDPFQSTSQQRPSAPTLKSIVSQNLWLFKHKSHGSDPIKKFVNELQGDLEAIYVGQMCLSWEFLHWQYEKALELWNSDPQRIHRYNEVAGEFQQFQVLMQRFIEDEPFQGPRVHSYVKSRCVLRNLLQVPVIREDGQGDKKKDRKKDTDEHVITSDMLVEAVEESIRVFWRFVRFDKDCNTLAINGNKKTVQVHNPEDLKLLVETRKSLQKKERKVKDILRSENCILRRFRQHREDDSDQALSFFAQVDMKLVCRVLNMSKITRDQLIWCQNKLSRISFVHRKIVVEPAFLLFPC